MAEAEKTILGGWEVAHEYGDRVHVLNNIHLLTLLARLGSKDARHPEIPALVRTIYRAMMIAVSSYEFPRTEASIPTRMVDQHPDEGVYHGPIVDPATNVVIVDIVRGGIVPSQTCFEMLTSVLPDANVRLDHLNMERRSDTEGRVVGVDLMGSKIGGSVADAILVLPDPMGATGSTTVRAVEHYLEHFGDPKHIVAMHMIITPEYLRRVLDRFENMAVYASRLDRGLSPPDVLATRPGTHWDRERGLNEQGYIVPGAGGMGEVLNNSWC